VEIGIISLSDIRTDPVTGRPFPDHHPAGEIAGLRKSRGDIGGRPIRPASAGSTRANSPARLAANMPVSMTAALSGNP